MPDEACASCMPNGLQSGFQKHKSGALLQLHVQHKLCAICASPWRSHFYYHSICRLCSHKALDFLPWKKHWHRVINSAALPPTKTNVLMLY